MMEADVTKTQHLANNLPNNPVSVGLHPVAGQGQVLDNHNWKPVEAQDSQSTINHVQEMLDQMSARGIQSMLVTVGPFGEIGVHGSQKGQLFLKENSDIGDRFAKMCTDHDVWTLLGAQKRFIEIGRANQNKGVFSEKGDYPLDFSHERGSYFPAQAGTSERVTTQDNNFVQGILSQGTNQNKNYQTNTFLHGNFSQYDSRPNFHTGPFFQGGFSQGLSGSESFPQPAFMQGIDTTSNINMGNQMITVPQNNVSPSGNAHDKNNGITQSEADIIKEMLNSAPVQEVINSSGKSSKEKLKNKEKTDKEKEALKKKRERRPETWQRNIKKKLKTEGKAYVNAKGKLVPAKKMRPVDCSKCKQRCTEKISEETRKKIFEWFWKLGSYTAQKEFVVSRVTQVATKTSKRRHVHRLFSFEINGKYESVCKPFFSRTLGIGDSYIYKAFEQKARDLFVQDGRGKHAPVNKTTEEQIDGVHQHLDHYLTEYPVTSPLPKNIHAVKWYDEYLAKCGDEDKKPVSKHIYRKIFQEYARKYPSPPDKNKSNDKLFSSESEESRKNTHNSLSDSSVDSYMIDIAGSQREEELEDRNSNTDNSVPEHEDDTDCGDDSCIDETPKTNTEEQEGEKTNLETNVSYNTRSMKKLGKLSRGTKSKMPVQKDVKAQRTDSGTGMPNLEVFDENIAERSIRIENRSPSKKSKKSDLLSLGRKTDAINKDNQKLQKLTSTTPTKVSRTYNCKKCNEPFPSTVAHNRHLRSKVCFIKNKYDNDFEKVTCKQCKLLFPRQDYLDVHMAVHEESVPQNFDVKFTDISKQISDIEVKEDTSPLKCKTCGQQFKEKRLLLHHTIIMHGMSFICKVCEATFETKYKCWSHQRLHEDRSGKSTAKSTFHCKYCSMTFSTKSALEQHYISCHSEGSVTSFPCDKCKKAFSNESFLEQHKVKMHGKKFVCTHEGCNKSFTSLYILEQHSLTHEERSFMCSICGKLFNNRRNFNAHSTVHENERRYECDVCKKTYKTSDVLSKHKRIHAATRRFYCDICGWGFNQSGTLKKHLNSHLNIKKYQCEVCSQKFANKSSLTNHKLLQGHFVPGSENEKGVIKAKKCEYCDKLFPPGSTYMYKRHVVIHTGVKAHTCDFCGKSFSDRSNLKYHRLTHVEDKPFVCSVCGRGFIQKRGLRKHLESSVSCNKSNSEMNQQFREDDSGADTLVSAFHRPTSILVNTDDTDMVIAASTSEDVAQRQVPVYVQESFSSEAVEAVMGISGTEQGTNIPRNVLDLSGNSSAEEGSWIYAKQWN